MLFCEPTLCPEAPLTHPKCHDGGLETGPFLRRDAEHPGELHVVVGQPASGRTPCQHNQRQVGAMLFKAEVRGVVAVSVHAQRQVWELAHGLAAFRRVTTYCPATHARFAMAMVMFRLRRVSALSADGPPEKTSGMSQPAQRALNAAANALQTIMPPPRARTDPHPPPGSAHHPRQSP